VGIGAFALAVAVAEFVAFAGPAGFDSGKNEKKYDQKILQS
jgi:hypothetical protein